MMLCLKPIMNYIIGQIIVHGVEILEISMIKLRFIIQIGLIQFKCLQSKI